MKFKLFYFPSGRILDRRLIIFLPEDWQTVRTRMMRKIRLRENGRKIFQQHARSRPWQE